jgi:hypothetical protein
MVSSSSSVTGDGNDDISQISHKSRTDDINLIAKWFNRKLILVRFETFDNDLFDVHVGTIANKLLTLISNVTIILRN